MPPSRPAMVKVKMPRMMKRECAEGGEGGEALEVVLDEGDERAVDDADGSERDHERGDAVGLRQGRCRRRSAGWSRGRAFRRGP